MKKLMTIAISLLSVFAVSSCLNANLVELDTYSGCEIQGVQGVYHRYYLNSTIPLSGERQVKQTGLNVSNVKIDSDAATCTFDVEIPSNFPEDQTSSVDASNLVVIFNISTASVIAPVGNAPTLGVPGNWTASNKYQVTAATGQTKVWTVSLNFKK